MNIQSEFKPLTKSQENALWEDRGPKPMNVTPIPGEQGRFFVESSSGREPHVVDLQWKETSWSKPIAYCGCEQSMAKGKVCRHIIAAVNHEKERLGL